MIIKRRPICEFDKAYKIVYTPRENGVHESYADSVPSIRLAPCGRENGIRFQANFFNHILILLY